MRVAAADLGATSGRIVTVDLTDNGPLLDEVSRFRYVSEQNEEGRWQWPIDTIYASVLDGLAEAATRGAQSWAVDSWGVDFGVVQPAAPLGTHVGPVYSYRDPFHGRGVSIVEERITWPDLYNTCGIARMPINTVYQLAAENAARLSDNTVLLHMPDLIGYWATGVLANDVTQASTSSLVDVRTRQWSPSVLHALGFPASNFLPLSEPGLIRGESLDPRLGRMLLVGAPTHDTASAFVGTPLVDRNEALILSLGTWALIGVEATDIVPTQAARDLNLTHELGVDGTVRFLSNLQGMWLLEECRRWWAQQDGVSPDLADLIEAARISTPWKYALDSEAPELAEPGQSPITLANWITSTGEVSEWYGDRGAVVRSILEAIVVRVAQRAREIEVVLGKPRATLHVVGGGSRIPMLMQWLADATGKEVIAGPVEAAAVGNAVIQWQAHGQLRGVEEGRSLIRLMPEIRRYFPEGSMEPWRAAEHR